MKATISEAKLLKSSIEAISNIIDEAGIIVSQQGMSLRAMDPAHVAFVDLEIYKEAFEEYSVEEELTLGLDLDRLNTILKRAGSGDRITLSTEDSSVLKIEIKNASTRKFELPLIEISEEEIKLPQLEFPAVVELDPKILTEGIKDAEIVSDNIIFRADSENFYISAKGDLGNVEVKVSKEDTIDFNVSEECRSMFSIEYLKDMMKASDIARTARLYFGTDIPLKLEFIAPDAKLSFLLAPRVESE